jgi:hypothetical protein
MNKRHIYKHAIEANFFSILNNDNDVEKVEKDGKPSIYLKEDENTQVWWSYDDVEQRNNDFDVITELKYKMVG